MEYNTEKLNEYASSLAGFKELIVSTGQRYSNTTTPQIVEEYQQLIEQAAEDLPGLLLPFNEASYRLDRFNRELYSADALTSHVIRNLSIVNSKLKTASATPVLISKDFSFIQDSTLREILTRDYLEIQKSIISGALKATIILCGGSIEAILLDLLKKDEENTRASAKAPSEQNLDKWSLNDLIEVAVDKNLVAGEIAKLSHSVREYRNLIHPGLEIRGTLKVESEEAKIAIEVLNILIRELSA